MNFKNTPAHKSIRIPTAELPPGPDKLRRVVTELDVENSPRYRATPDGRTYCNIFVSDVLDAFSLPPSHWMPADGQLPLQGGAMIELTANAMLRWLAAHGERNGWTQVDRSTALAAASRGHVVLVGWDSRTAKPGHIAVVLPEGTIAQAGRTNFVGRTVREGFGTLPVQFWVQQQGGSHTP